MPMNTLYNIQYLRAFAAISVVLFHTIGTGIAYGRPVHYLGFFQAWGSSGVDLFFVISGFVMIYTQSSHKRSAYEFFLNRLTRIAPLYWILTLLVCTLFWFMPKIFNTEGMPSLWVISSLFFSSQISAGRLPVMYVGWSLEYEMIFYSMFAVGLLIKDFSISVLVMTSTIFALVFLGFSNPIMLEFVFGMFCGLVFKRWRQFRLGWTLFILGGVMLISSRFFSPVDDLMGYSRVVFWGVPSALIVLSVCWFEQAYQRTLSLIGDASYSIYLIQVFTISASYKLYKSHLIFLPNDAVAALVVASTVLTGVVIFKFIERPVNSACKRYLRSKAPIMTEATSG
ncbi:MAG: acyltransferase family protein [Methylocystis sp.]|uniref:acyltransferase family protein n=1 Tax=Methylocystis sp. TaxID=1911079 RepID=UPI003DA5E10E